MFGAGNTTSPEFIVLDVSGVCYRLMKKKTRRFQSSLFSRLLSGGSTNFGVASGNSEIVWLAPNKFFVQRSPALFDIVLQYYITGKLHLPNWACKESIAEELAFWNLKPEDLCNVCCDKEHYDEDECTNDEYGKAAGGRVVINNERHRRATFISNKWHIYRYRLWAMCEHPRSSKAALIFTIISTIFISFSTLNLIVESIPSVQYCLKDGTLNLTVQNQSADDYESTKEPDPDDLLFDFKSSCVGSRIFEWIDLVCIIYFTVELIVRFLVCPTIRQFFTNPWNIVDLLATIPYHIELIIWAVDRNNYVVGNASMVLFLLLVMRNLRVLRILKIARYSRGLRALAVTLRAAKRELFLLLSVLLLCVIIFSSVMYQLEKEVPNSEFNSVPAAGWWCIGTISLVGFGDMSPKTTGGKIVAAVMCAISMFVIALPISVFVEHFAATYKNQATLSILKKRKHTNECSTGGDGDINGHTSV